MVAVVRIEWRRFYRFLVGVVDGEFSEGQEACPIILLMVAVDTQVLFNNLVHPFCLTIGLEMERC